MQTNPVESSMIARVGYDAGILRAVMKDGSAYDVPECSAAEFAAFMADPSKGQHWHRVFKSRAALKADFAEGGPAPIGTPHLVGGYANPAPVPSVADLEKALSKGGNVDCHFGVQSMRRAR